MAKKVSRIEVVEDDIFSALRKSSISTEAKTRLLKDSLIEIDAALKKIKKDAAGIKGGLFKTDPSDVKNQKDIAQAMKESSRLAADNTSKIRAKANATKLLTVEEAKLKEATRRANVETKQIARLQMAAKGSVEQLRAKLQVLTTQYDKLSTAERTNTDRGKRLKAGIDQTTASVTKLEQATGRHQRNVGNYGSALDGLKGKFRSLIGFVGQLGVAMGGALLVREGLKTLTEFDEKLADIAKTTGLTTQAARELSVELFEIDTRTSITNLQELLSAAGRLGIQGKDNLLAFTEAADKVFVALGDDLEGTAEEIATNLGKIASVFGLEGEFGIGTAIEKVGSGINELSANSKASGGAIQDFTNRMAGLASVLELQDVQALGSLFDEAGQSTEVAASTMMKLLPELSKDYERFAKVAGMTPEAFKKIAEESPIDALKAVATGAKSNEKGLFALTETLESYGIESARASGIVGVLTNNVGRLTELQEIATTAMEENTSITDEFNTKNDTLAATWDKVIKRVQQWVIEGDSAVGITNKLKSSLAFLADNLENIVKAIGIALKLFVIYKTRIIAMNLAQKAFGDGTGKMNFNLKQLSANLKDAGGGLKGFASAAKGVGWAALIVAVVEFGKAFWDVASGAQFARYQIEQLEKASQKGTELGSKYNEQLKKNLNDELRIIEMRLSTGEISEKEAIRLRLVESKRHQKRVEEKIKELRVILEEQRVIRALNKEKLDGYEKDLALGIPLGKAQAKDLIKLRNEYVSSGKSVEGLKGAIRELRAGYVDSSGAISDLVIEQNNLNKGLGDSAKEAKALNTELEKQNEYLSEQTELLEQLDEVSRRAEIRDIQTDIDAQIANLAKIARETGELDVDELESTIQRKFELEKQHIQERELFEINAIREKYRIDAALARQSLEDDKTKLLEQEGLSPAQKLEIEANYQKELSKLKQDELQRAADLELQIRLIKSASNEELIELQKAHNDEINEVNDELIDAQIQGAVETNDKIIDSDKEAADRRKEIADFITDYLIAQSNKRIDQLDKEIAAAESQSDFLKQLAVEGNINAKESIAEQQRIINEANKQKAKEEQLQQRIKLAGSVYSTFTAKTEAGSKNALAETITDITLLEAFINTLGSYKDGAEDTGTVSNPLDSDGGRLAKIHDNERILTKEQNAPLLKMGLSNDELVRRIQMADIREKTERLSYTTGWENTAFIAELSGLKTEMINVKKAIENKPVTEYSLEYVTNELFNVVKKVTTGNDIIYNRYRQDK